MQTAVVGMAKPAENDLALVRASVAIEIRQRDQVRRVREVQLSITPRQAHWKGYILLENRPLVVAPITVAVFQPRHAAISRQLFQSSVKILSRRFGDVEPA